MNTKNQYFLYYKNNQVYLIIRQFHLSTNIFTIHGDDSNFLDYFYYDGQKKENFEILLYNKNLQARKIKNFVIRNWIAKNKGLSPKCAEIFQNIVNNLIHNIDTAKDAHTFIEKKLFFNEEYALYCIRNYGKLKVDLKTNYEYAVFKNMLVNTDRFFEENTPNKIYNLLITAESQKYKNKKVDYKPRFLYNDFIKKI